MADIRNAIGDQRWAMFTALDEAFTLCEMIYNDAGEAVDYRVKAVNPACETMTGIRSEDYVGRTGKALMPALVEQWTGMFVQAVDTGQPIRFESYDASHDRWYSTLAFSAGVHQFGMLARDVTAAKRTEQALQDSEARYRVLVYASADTFYRMNADASLLLEVFNHGQDEASPVILPNPRWLEDYVHPDDQAETSAKFQAARAAQRNFVHEHRVRRRDGTTGWVLSRAFPVFDAPGTLIEWIGSSSDITDHKRSEQHNLLVGQFAADLAAALTTQQVTDIMMSAAGRAIEGGMTSVYRVSADGKELMRLTHSDDTHFGGHNKLALKDNLLISTAVQTRQFACIETRAALIQFYPHLKQMFDNMKTNAIGCFPFFGSNRAVIGALYVMLTDEQRTFSLAQQNVLFAMAQVAGQALERTLLTEQAQEMAAAQERHRIAHDLHDSVNQVLFASTLFAEALPKTWERNPEAARGSVKKVVTLNRAAMAEMRKLLLELRPSAISQTPFAKLLQQLIHAAQGMDEIDAELEYSGPEELLLPPEKHVALYRIAQEAVNNVTKHSGASHLTIAFNGERRPIRLVIADDGRGFDPARAAKGMGLNTMRERAQRAGAKFAVTSAPGEGTQISVELA